MKKKLLIALGIVILLGVFMVTIFPRLFWAWHASATKKLKVGLQPGCTDLEYQYGQDENGPVETQRVKISEELEYTFFYPAGLEEAPYPVVVWGNGTGNTWENYEVSLRSLSSYGFVVVGCNDSNMGSGQVLYDMALYARGLNQDPDSPLYGKLDPDRFGVGGHSQGACGAVNAATCFPESKTLFRSLYTTSMPKLSMCVDGRSWKFGYWAYDVGEIAVPYFATTGTWFLDSLWISPLADMEENFAGLQPEVPAYMARQRRANHNVVNEFHASGYLNAWFCWTLRGDAQAGTIFQPEGELYRNPRWTDAAGT